MDTIYDCIYCKYPIEEKDYVLTENGPAHAECHEDAKENAS